MGRLRAVCLRAVCLRAVCLRALSVCALSARCLSACTVCLRAVCLRAVCLRAPGERGARDLRDVRPRARQGGARAREVCKGRTVYMARYYV